METKVIEDRIHWQSMTDHFSRKDGNTVVHIAAYNEDKGIGVIVYEYIKPNRPA